jgi:hypothetical protein
MYGILSDWPLGDRFLLFEGAAYAVGFTWYGDTQRYLLCIRMVYRLSVNSVKHRIAD